MSRYETYATLMRDQVYWGRTLGIISCKIIRERPEFKKEWDILVAMLQDPSTLDLLDQRDWRIAVTGGTYAALPESLRNHPRLGHRLFGLAPSALGVIQIANLVVHRHLFSVAFFNHMEDFYADSPQNLCLRRICNYFETPLLEDASSILFFMDKWKRGLHLPEMPRGFPNDALDQYYGTGRSKDEVRYREELAADNREDRSCETIAIVSHDMRKMTMLTFCLEHMSQILSYRRVISTGTTGKFLANHFLVALEAHGSRFTQEELKAWGWGGPEAEPARAFLARKIYPLASGPEGGDVQISAKVIDGSCHRVLFFQDPERAHPHQFDIRLMEKAVQDPDTGALFATSAKTARVIV